MRSSGVKAPVSPSNRASNPISGFGRRNTSKSPSRSTKTPVESIAQKSPKRSPARGYQTSTYLQGFNPAKYGSVAAYKDSQEHQNYIIQKEQILRQLNMNQAEKQQKLNKIKQ